jgi:hypothetical protein
VANLRRHNQQTVAWFNDLYTRGLLDLEPPYQRRSVWNQAYKDAFIDTILIQYPSPAVFLYQEISPEGQTKMHVVDGKQRLTSIFEFVSGVFPVAETAQTSQLRGKYFEQLPVEVKTNFWTYEFSVEYLPTNEEGLINGIFERINRNTAKLTRQELRHARFSGLFITAAEQLADWMTKQLPDNFPRFESQSRKQMKDVELVAGLLLLIEEGIGGYSQDDLDKAFSDRDVEWEDAADTEQRFREVTDFVNQLVQLPQQDPLLRSRLRNQADFYSLFGAINELIDVVDPVLNESKDILASRLRSFVEIVDDEVRRIKDEAATRYLNAARSNSNDLGQRKQRVETITTVLRG